MKGEPYQCPLQPFGGMEQISWTPDSKIIAYTCKKLKGLASTLSTNSDIYFYNVAKKTTVDMTKGMMGYDVAPVFSPDGRYMAWEKMPMDFNGVKMENMSILSATGMPGMIFTG